MATGFGDQMEGFLSRNGIGERAAAAPRDADAATQRAVPERGDLANSQMAMYAQHAAYQTAAVVQQVAAQQVWGSGAWGVAGSPPQAPASGVPSIVVVPWAPTPACAPASASWGGTRAGADERQLQEGLQALLLTVMHLLQTPELNNAWSPAHLQELGEALQLAMRALQSQALAERDLASLRHVLLVAQQRQAVARQRLAADADAAPARAESQDSRAVPSAQAPNLAEIQASAGVAVRIAPWPPAAQAGPAAAAPVEVPPAPPPLAPPALAASALAAPSPTPMMSITEALGYMQARDSQVQHAPAPQLYTGRPCGVAPAGCGARWHGYPGQFASV